MRARKRRSAISARALRTSFDDGQLAARSRGIEALIDNEPRSATAIAITDVELVPVSESQFLFMVRRPPYELPAANKQLWRGASCPARAAAVAIRSETPFVRIDSRPLKALERYSVLKLACEVA
jgi:hypothetical protein